MAARPPFRPAFILVLEKFKASLTETEKKQFGTTSLHDLHLAIEAIQKKQQSQKRLQGMKRLEVFLEGMKEYDKIVSIFLNSCDLLAFVWGPMKFLLQIASAFHEAFDALMDAYQRIGEQLPLLSQYETYFRNRPHMIQVLRLLYEDILSFHWEAMKYFKRPMWRQLFHAVWKSFDTEFASILRNIREHRTLIEQQATITQFAEIMRLQDMAKEILERQKIDENQRRRERLYQWLSPVSSEVDQETFAKVRQECPGTGGWLLNVNKFHAWFDPDFSSTQLLWLNGIPGAGKTTLASLVIEEARKLRDVTVAFFYCAYEDAERNTFLAVARGILAQLLHQDETLLHYLYDKSSTSGQIKLSTESLAKELLETAIKNCPKLYVIVDGVDECERDERRQIVSFFESLWESLPPDDVDTLRCLFVSQDDSAARKDFANMVSLRVAEENTKKDIRAYVHARSLKMQGKFELPDDRRRFIEDMITEKAEGMFLFAKLLSSHLAEQTSIAKVDEELLPGNFPRGPSKLDKLYDRITKRLFEDSGPMKPDRIRLLGWLVCARRPLKWREIQCAVAVDVESSTVNWETSRFRVDSKDLCGSLIDVRVDDSVNLVHQTAKRYLAEKKLNIAAEELALTRLCLNYLSLDAFDDDNLEHKDIERFMSQGYYGFFEYAYAYWSRHLEKSLSTARHDNELQELLEDLTVFIEMHWIYPKSSITIPRSISERLKLLKETAKLDKIGSAIFVARKQLNVSVKSSQDEQVLKLGRFLETTRVTLEDMMTDFSKTQKCRQMYGSEIYKCPKLHCTRFYNGFSTAQQRDEHVPKHERSFFCSFPGCPTATLGIATLKELQKHENEYHGTIDVDDDADFPELPPEKVSFDCTQCSAKFTRNHNLKIHMRTHNAPNAKNFTCSTCGKGFVRQGDRARHESTSHSGTQSFICGGTLKDGSPWGCSRTFNRGDTLARHFKSEKGRACLVPKEAEEVAESTVSTPSMQEAHTAESQM